MRSCRTNKNVPTPKQRLGKHTGEGEGEQIELGGASKSGLVLAIAYRDPLKFLRDPARMASTFVFPLIFIGALGGSLQAYRARRYVRGR